MPALPSCSAADGACRIFRRLANDLDGAMATLDRGGISIVLLDYLWAKPPAWICIVA